MNLNLRNSIKPSKVASVNVHFCSLTEYEISVCQLTRKGNSLLVVKKQTGLTEISVLKDSIPLSVPVLLSVTGKTVLNKEYGITGDGTDESQFLPNNQEADFYCYEYRSESMISLSLCRKTIIDDLINQLAGMKYLIVGMAIGPYAAAVLWEYKILAAEQAIPVSGGELKYKAQSSTFHYTNHPKENITDSVLVGDDFLDNRLMVPYSAALLWLFESTAGSLVGDNPPQLTGEFKYKYLIDKTKYIFLSVIFGVLLINFLVFDSFRKRETSISNELIMNTGIISKRDSLDKELKAKEEFIKYIGENKTFYSYYLDEIAASVPDRIVLEKLAVNPVTVKVQRNEQIVADKKIVIRGLSANSLILNQWSKELSMMRWVKATNVVSFEKNAEDEMSSFILEVEERK